MMTYAMELNRFLLTSPDNRPRRTPAVRHAVVASDQHMPGGEGVLAPGTAGNLSSRRKNGVADILCSLPPDTSACEVGWS